MIRRLVSSLTAVCFLFSFVCAPALEGAAAFADAAQDADPPLQNSLVSSSLGRVTGSKNFNSPSLVVNIQDLHCHPGVQRNIAALLAELDKTYSLQTVFVEGGYGDVDTSWLSAVPDAGARRQIVEDLLRRGALTGAEYYAMTSGRYGLLKGLEDERLHRQNLVRLGTLLGDKPRFERALRGLRRDLGFMQAKYFSDRNRRLNRAVEQYRQGKLAPEQYYCLLSRYVRRINENPDDYNLRFVLSMDDYPDITRHCRLMEMQRHLNFGKVRRELPQFVQSLKDRLPYRAYETLLGETGNFSRPDALVAALDRPENSALLEQAGRFPYLSRYVAYVRLNNSIDPLRLVNEEKRLVEQLRAAFSRNAAEAEVSFLSDFYGSFEDYLLDRLSAGDYAYFTDRFAKFQATWGKYVYRNRILELSDDFPLLDAFYAANARRNEVFLSRLTREQGKPAPGVSVVVTGGFHTEGFTRLLEERGISYITITPNVGGDTGRAADAYRSLALRAAKRYASEALALTLPSCHARVLEATDKRIQVQLENGDTYSYVRIGDRWMYGQGRTVLNGNVDYNEEITGAVREAARMAAGVLPRRIGYTVELVNALIAAAGEWGSPGLWGGNGVIWEIVRAAHDDPEIDAYLSSNINVISQLPEFLQRSRLEEAARRASLRELALQGNVLAPLLEMPGMQAFWKIINDAENLQERLKDESQKNVGITFTKGDVTHAEFLGMMAAIPPDFEVLVTAEDGRAIDARTIPERDFAGIKSALSAKAIYHRYRDTAYKVSIRNIVNAGLIAPAPLTEDDEPFTWLRESFFPALSAEEMRTLFEDTPAAEWEAAVKGYIAAHPSFVAGMADPGVIGDIGADNPKLIDAYRRVAMFYYSIMTFSTPYIPLCAVKKPSGRPNYAIMQEILQQTRERISLDQTETVYDYLYEKLPEDLQKPGLFTVSPRDDRQGFEAQLEPVLNALNGQNAVKYLLISATFPLHATGPRLEFARRKLRDERYQHWNEIITGKPFDPSDVENRNKRALPIALVINGMHCSNTFEIDADVRYVLTAAQKRRIGRLLDENGPRATPPGKRGKRPSPPSGTGAGETFIAPDEQLSKDKGPEAVQVKADRLRALVDRFPVLFDEIPDVTQRDDGDPLKQAVEAFQSYRLADALRLLSAMQGSTLRQVAALVRLRGQFPAANYPPEIWNTSNVDLEEQIALFRALEHTLNVLCNWESLPSDQVQVPVNRKTIPDFWANDPMGHKKKEAFVKGTKDFYALLLSLFPGADDRPLQDPEQAEYILRAALMGILRGNRGDDLSRSPEEASDADVFYQDLDHRDECVRVMRESADLAFLTDNVGGETFSVLLEAWLLLRSGKNVTIYSKQEPSLFSDTTLRDLRYSIDVFDEILKTYFGEDIPTLNDFLGDTFHARQLNFPYVYNGEKQEGHNIISYNFGFLRSHDAAIVIGELQYGDFVRQEVRRRLGALTGYTRECVNLNPFSRTALVFLKSRKNPREIVWAPRREGATRGEFICQVFLPQPESAQPAPGARVLSIKDEHLPLAVRMANEGRSALGIALQVMSLEGRERVESPETFIAGHTRKDGARFVARVTRFGRYAGRIVAVPVVLCRWAFIAHRSAGLKEAWRSGRERGGRAGGALAGGAAQVILDTVVFSKLTRAVDRFGAASIDPEGRVHVFVKFVSGTPEQNRELGILPEDLRNLGLGNMFVHVRTGSFLVFVPEGQTAEEAENAFSAAVKGLGERPRNAPLFKKIRSALGGLGLEGVDAKLQRLVPGIHIVEGDGEARFAGGEMIVPQGRFGGDFSPGHVASTLGALMRERRQAERALEAARYFGVSAETPEELVRKLSCFRGATAGNIVIPGVVFDKLDKQAVQKAGAFFRAHSLDVFVDLGADAQARERYRADYQYNGFAGYVHTDAQGDVNIVRYNAEKGAFDAAVKPDVLKLDGDSGNCDAIAGRLLNDRSIPLLVDLTDWVSGKRPRDLSQAAAVSALVIDLLQKDALALSLKEQAGGFDPQYLKDILAAG